MRLMSYALLAGAWIASSATLAQNAATPVAAPIANLTLRQGTAVEFRTEQALSSRTAHVGDRFELRSIDAVMVGGQVIIPAGARAVGEVTNVVKKGGFGRSGKLDTRVLYVVVGEQHISMAGKAHDQGAGGTAGTVAAAVLLWPVMPFVTGKSAEFPIGFKMDGFVENDLPVTVAASSPVAALVVPATPVAPTLVSAIQ